MNRPKQDDEAEIEASRAPLLSHLAELRSRLMVALATLVVAFAICFTFAQDIFVFLTDPFVFAMRRVDPEHAGEAIRMVNTDALGFFMVKMKVALFAAVCLSFPVLAWQAYAFVAPGLYRRERAAVAPFLAAAPIMFTLGGAFVYYIAMPFALEFALSQQVTAGQIRVEYLPKVDEYVGLETTLVLAFGLFFQMPVVLSLLARIGVVNAKMLWNFWRYALIGIALFSALVTPPDILSMSLMTVPLFGIYLLSILLVWLIEKRDKQAEVATTQAAE